MTHRDIEHLTRGEQQQLTAALTNLIDWIAETLDDAITRQHGRTANPKVTGGTTEQPLPFNDRASEIGWNLRNTLNAWIAETATARRYPQPGRLNLIPAARWLRRNIIGLAISDHAQTAADEILDAINQAARHLDRPTRPDYLGTCPNALDDGTTCNADLWALPTDELIVCRNCNTAHHRDTITNLLEQHLRTQYLPATELAPLITDRTGTPITPKAIHNLGRHRARSIETTSRRRLYHAGDILDALTEPTPQRQPQHAEMNPGT